MRKSFKFLIFVSVCVSGSALLLVGHPLFSMSRFESRFEKERAVVERLWLADACLFTESLHARHPSQADLFSIFGEHPGALERFPSGSMARPPLCFIRKTNEVCPR